MKNNPILTALPIGEIDTPLVQSQLEGIIAVFRHLGADVALAEPVSDEAGVRQALEAVSQKDQDLLLLVPLRGLSAQLIEAAGNISAAPCVIWPIQGRFALPSSALAAGALREAARPVELFYAPPGHNKTPERVNCLLKAATAFSRLKRSRIGVVGGLFPNLVACRYDARVIQSRLGATLLPVSYDDLRYAMDRFSTPEETHLARNEITGRYRLAPIDTSHLEAGIRLHLALKQIAQERQLDGLAVECWSGLPNEIGLNPCLGFIEDAYTLACEGDVMAGLALLIARYITSASAYVGDLYDLDLDGNLTLTHCGAPASLAANPGAVLLAQSQLALERGFATLTCRPQLNPGMVTVFRLYGQACDRLHLASGELTGSAQTPNSTVEIRLSGDRWDFLDHCLGNHYVVVAGDIRSELKLLGKWMGITINET